MKWVLVTGAGASRELGRERTLPLMGEWAALLCEELDSRESGLADAIGLRSDMGSDDFERALGALTTWVKARALAPNFFGLTGPQPGHVPNNVQAAFAKEGERLETIVEGLRTSLYAEFGTERIDEGAAASAYEGLLDAVGKPEWLVCATTNYDPSAELALETLGRNADTGFRRPPARTPQLDPTGLVERATQEGVVPVLHLHGAVGWYERGGKVLEYSPDQAYNPSHGTPAVLYPDPDKDPTQEAPVQALWTEFEHALGAADRILVCGHSLNDPVLVETLTSHASRRRVGVAVHLGSEHREKTAAAIQESLPGAMVVEVHVGPEVEIGPSFHEWLSASLETG